MAQSKTGVRWQSIEPGLLRNQVQLASTSTQTDSFGDPLSSWNVYLTDWAQIRLLSGHEQLQGSEFSTASQYRITIRWPGPSVNINIGDRVIFGGRTFAIQVVDNVEMRNILLQLTCTEIQTGS